MVYEDNQLIYWGWPLCTRTTYRFIEHYESATRLIKAIQKYTPFFKPGFDYPKVEANFEDQNIEIVEMGCGFISVVDSLN